MYSRLSLLFSLLLLGGCAITATRPSQEMSDTSAALHAAQEVQADVLAPELYRQAREWFNRAKREYKFKNFKEAKEAAAKARTYAEQAEMEALKNGANRKSTIPDPMEGKEVPPAAKPEAIDDAPKGVYYETEEEKRANEKSKSPDGDQEGPSQ